LLRNNVKLQPGLATILKSAYLREQLRYTSYRNILSDALATLVPGSVSAIILKGAALAETAYPEPALRHSHDIDLLIEPRSLSSAVSLLVASGLRPLPSRGKRAIQSAVLCHASGLPLGLYTRLFQIPYYCGASQDGARAEEICRHTSSHGFGGVEGHILSPAANLLQVCGHASYSSSRRSLLWVCDAWFLIHSKPQLDWDVFCDLTARCNLSLPLSVMLSYLARELNAPVPSAVLERIEAAAAHTDSLGREIALVGAHKTANGKLRNLIGKANRWEERIIALKWILFPSARYLRMMQDVRYPRLMPLYYLLRPLRYIARRLMAHWKQLPQRTA
jgi:hypothetical protein